MRLLSVIVSYQRFRLLKQTVESYRATVTVPHRLVVVDNASAPRIRRWLAAEDFETVFLPENRYPGYATNRGWEHGLQGFDATLLHRSDNDMKYLPGWCDEVAERFSDPAVGQVGLRTFEEEGDHAAVGGNSIIRRELYDAGARYTEAPWSECAFEDGQLSGTVAAHGYRWVRVQRPCALHMGTDYTQAYYRETFAVRGIGPPPA